MSRLLIRPAPVQQQAFGGSWWNRALPDNATVDPMSAQVVAEIVAQSQEAQPALNVYTFSAEPLEVPANQPLVPVICTHDATSQQIAALGLPIPPGTRPTDDYDATLTIWQPDFTGQYGVAGRYYELYHAEPNVDANGLEHWSCSNFCRYIDVNEALSVTSYLWQLGPGYEDYATDPDTTYTWAPYIQGSGIAYMPGVLSLADVQRGYVDHTLLLEAVYSRGSTMSAPGFVWPAYHCDGNSSTSLVREGQRFRFPPGYQSPAAYPIQELIIQGVRDYGCCVTDQSGCLAFRAAPSVGADGYLDGVPHTEILDGFPWQDLELLTVGSDTNPTPTT